MSETKQLKVGDKVILYYAGEPKRITEVVRTTKTQAILKGGTRLRIDYTGEYLSEITSDRWSSWTFGIATDEAVEQLYLRQLQLRTKNMLSELQENARHATQNLTSDECNEAIELLNRLTKILTK
jgi:predicted RNA-binding protein with PUA-like domain